jgi:hypothetical protein
MYVEQWQKGSVLNDTVYKAIGIGVFVIFLVASAYLMQAIRQI